MQLDWQNTKNKLIVGSSLTHVTNWPYIMKSGLWNTKITITVKYFSNLSTWLTSHYETRVSRKNTFTIKFFINPSIWLTSCCELGWRNKKNTFTMEYFFNLNMKNTPIVKYFVNPIPSWPHVVKQSWQNTKNTLTVNPNTWFTSHCETW